MQRCGGGGGDRRGGGVALHVDTGSNIICFCVDGSRAPRLPSAPSPRRPQDKSGLLLLVTAGKDGALTGGGAFMSAVGDDLIDSVVGDNLGILAGEDKFNEAVTSSVARIVARLEGKADPGAPFRADVVRQRTYRTKKETEAKKPVTATIVGTLLVISGARRRQQRQRCCAVLCRAVLC